MYRGHRIGVAVPAYNEEALIGETHTWKGLYPSAGVKTLAWYLRPGRRGVSIVDIRDGDPAIAFKSWLGWVQGTTSSQNMKR